jgi:hypothetical protein
MAFDHAPSRPAAFAALAVAAVVAFLTALSPAAPLPAHADSDGLSADVSVTYDVRPDEPTVRVTWDVLLENSGPPFYAEAGEPPYFYHDIAVTILGDGANVAAVTPDGRALPVSFFDYGDGLSGEATVGFGRTLRYDDTFAFSLRYDVPETRNDLFLVGPYYVFLPAYPDLYPVDTFRSATVNVIAPNSRQWDVSVSGAACEEFPEAGRVLIQCSTPDLYSFAAAIEVLQPSARQSTSTLIPLGDSSIELRVVNFPGNEAWAGHVADVTAVALPTLAEIIGFPYNGPDTLRVTERGQGELFGYAGLADCNPWLCGIAVSPASDDMVLLHELAHLWTQPFYSRWIAEGIAEFASQRTADRLGIDGLAIAAPTGDRPPIPLDTWGELQDQLTSSLEQQQIETESYYWSALMFERLEQSLGAEAIKTTNAALSTELDYSVDTRLYVDSLEDAGGAVPDDLLVEWVFPEEEAGQVRDRRVARTRLADLIPRAAAAGLTADVTDDIAADIDAWIFHEALPKLDAGEAGLAAYLDIAGRLEAFHADAEAAGLPYPLPFSDAAQTWDFQTVGGSLDDAEAALSAYVAAQDAANAPRSPLQRIGLWGKDPDAHLAAAAESFAWGNFAQSIDESRQAESLIEGAVSAALPRLLIVIAVLAAVAVAAVILLRWALRSETPVPPEPSEP